MTHINEDELLKYALEITATEAERSEIADHLDGCDYCRERLLTMQGDIEIMGSIKGHGFALLRPVRRGKRYWIQRIVRAAALLLLGFLAGLGVSDLSHREPQNIWPSYMEFLPPADSLKMMAVPDGTRIDPDYHDQIATDF